MAAPLPGGPPPKVPVEAYFNWAIEHNRRIGSRLYELLSQRCLGDPEVLELARETPAGQPASHLLMGAVHWLLMAAPSEPLARYYASLDPAPASPEDAYPVFRRFCLEHREAIADILRTRTVQVTLVGRNGHALPAIAEVAWRAPAPLSFVDVGCSAGLTTLFDHYSYDYGALGRIRGVAPVEVTGCSFIGTPPRIPKVAPQVARRVGIDLNPIDATDAAELRWIDALLPPELVAERRQLLAAFAYRARTPFELIRGDALAVLPTLLPTLPDPLCVFHSHCLYQWPTKARQAFDAVLRRESERRDVYRVGVEYPVDRPASEPQWPEAPDQLPLIDEITLVVYQRGEATRQLLGMCDGWGRRAQWLAA